LIERVCAIEKPPVWEIAGGQHIACHLDEETLQSMKPVIRIKDKRAEDAAF
jgi:peptide/nickel transport system ATP-binding protein